MKWPFLPHVAWAKTRSPVSVDTTGAAATRRCYRLTKAGFEGLIGAASLVARPGGWKLNIIRLAALAALLAGATTAAPAQDAAAKKVPPQLVAFDKALHKQTGDVSIPAAKAVLHLGDRYYFLGPGDAVTVLTKIWGNPPDAATGVLGMVFPADATTYDNVWGAVVTYQDSGYVPDTDAKSADYDKVLADSRAGEEADNDARKKAGYPEMHLVGWAQPPSYDPARHSLIWARDLRSSAAPVDGLNYDVRSLGRHGVLSLNMVSDMPHLAEVRDAAAAFGKAAAFERGQTYADYDKSVDKTAEYGLAGLVAAGVGVAAASKFGLFAILLALGKKLIVLVAIGIAALRKRIGGWFGRNKDSLEG